MSKTKRKPAYLEVNCPECGKQFKSEEEMLKHYDGHAKESTEFSQELTEDIKRAILWQNEEVIIDYMDCKEFFEDHSVSLGARVGHNGCLILTNQRIIFACKIGRLSQDYAVTYSINLEDIISVSHGRFGFNDKLMVLDKSSQHKDFIHPNIQLLIPKINSAIINRKTQIKVEEDKKRVQVVLDFSSLKDTLSKGGIVMAAYNCPNCNAMVAIPETGKVLICKHCGTPIKPVDIFEKIKSLF